MTPENTKTAMAQALEKALGVKAAGTVEPVATRQYTSAFFTNPEAQSGDVSSGVNCKSSHEQVDTCQSTENHQPETAEMESSTHTVGHELTDAERERLNRPPVCSHTVTSYVILGLDIATPQSTPLHGNGMPGVTIDNCNPFAALREVENDEEYATENVVCGLALGALRSSVAQLSSITKNPVTVLATGDDFAQHMRSFAESCEQRIRNDLQGVARVSVQFVPDENLGISGGAMQHNLYAIVALPCEAYFSELAGEEGDYTAAFTEFTDAYANFRESLKDDSLGNVIVSAPIMMPTSALLLSHGVELANNAYAAIRAVGTDQQYAWLPADVNKIVELFGESDCLVTVAEDEGEGSDDDDDAFIQDEDDADDADDADADDADDADDDALPSTGLTAETIDDLQEMRQTLMSAGSAREIRDFARSLSDADIGFASLEELFANLSELKTKEEIVAARTEIVAAIDALISGEASEDNDDEDNADGDDDADGGDDDADDDDDDLGDDADEEDDDGQGELIGTLVGATETYGDMLRLAKEAGDEAEKATVRRVLTDARRQLLETLMPLAMNEAFVAPDMWADVFDALRSGAADEALVAFSQAMPALSEERGHKAAAALVKAIDDFSGNTDCSDGYTIVLSGE